jgi:hypothetical protein
MAASIALHVAVGGIPDAVATQPAIPHILASDRDC